MGEPVRIQLKRSRGFRLQETSAAINGLPAVRVDRSTKHGNPFVVGEFPSLAFSAYQTSRVETAAQAVRLFRRALVNGVLTCEASVDVLLALRGKNLACWCRLDASCHGDVLLALANAPDRGTR